MKMQANDGNQKKIEHEIKEEWINIAGGVDKSLTFEQLRTKCKTSATIKKWIINLMNLSGDKGEDSSPAASPWSCLPSAMDDNDSTGIHWDRVFAILDEDENHAVSYEEFKGSFMFSVAVQKIFDAIDCDHDQYMQKQEFKKACSLGSDVGKTLRYIFRARPKTPAKKGGPPVPPGLVAVQSATPADFVENFWKEAELQEVLQVRVFDDDENQKKSLEDWKASHSIHMARITDKGIERPAFMSAMEKMWSRKHEILPAIDTKAESKSVEPEGEEKSA